MIYRPEISLCAGLVAMVGGISEMVHVLKMLYWGLIFLSVYIKLCSVCVCVRYHFLKSWLWSPLNGIKPLD